MLRSSLSTASFLHRSWNPHSGQCRLTTVSGGEAADNRDAACETFLCTARDNAAVFTESVASFAPCTIFAVPVFVPKAFASEIASNTAMILPEADSLLFATIRIGTNWDGTSVCGIRWISATSASHPWACAVSPTAYRQDWDFHRPGSEEAMPRLVSWVASFRMLSSR